jgi:tetratricopeptide (TPR) repeat protein
MAHLRLGEFLCCLDDDNVYSPHFLETMHRALVDAPTVGIALCAADDLRYGRHEMDGFPEYGRCDNSAFLVRSSVAKAVGFPYGGVSREVVQDYEFIRACADLAGWNRVPAALVQFGRHPNPPPRRGGTKIVYSWSLPIRGVQLVESGRVDEGIALLRAAIAFDPKDAWARWHLGEALLVSGRRDDATAEWQEWDRMVEAAGPTPHDWIDYCRALVGFIRGERTRGLAHLDCAIARAGERGQPTADPETLLNLFLYSTAAARPRQAVRFLKEALALNPPERVRRETARDLALLARLVPDVPEEWSERLTGTRVET